MKRTDDARDRRPIISGMALFIVAIVVSMAVLVFMAWRTDQQFSETCERDGGVAVQGVGLGKYRCIDATEVDQ